MSVETLPPPLPPATPALKGLAALLSRCQSSFFVLSSPWHLTELSEFIFDTWIYPDFSLQHPRTCYYDTAGATIPQPSPNKIFTPRTVFYADSETAAEGFRRGPFHGILAAADWEPSVAAAPWLDYEVGCARAGRLVPHTLSNCTTHRVWLWESAFPPRRALAIDMHMVPSDAQGILAAFNVRVDFYFTSDVADILMNAYHSELYEFGCTRDILGRDYNQPLSESLIAHVKSCAYDFMITGHTLYTTLVFAQLGLPMLHVNSTRFANGFTTYPHAFAQIHAQVAALLRTGRLTIFHNNRADEAYFNWYFPWFRRMYPGRCLHVPSLCEYGPRLRVRTPPGPRRYMFWDPRDQTFTDKSPYISALWASLKALLGDRIDRTADIKKGARHVDDGFQNVYAAIIHIPYNTSTMSMFEQSRACIPTWVPSQRLLEGLWNSPAEHNELSWYAFARDAIDGSAAAAAAQAQGPACVPDRINRREVVAAYAARTDFYDGGLGGVLVFDTADDLLRRIDTTDYDAVIAKTRADYVAHRANIYSVYKSWLTHNFAESK